MVSTVLTMVINFKGFTKRTKKMAKAVICGVMAHSLRGLSKLI